MAMSDVAVICFVTLDASHFGSIIICSLTLMSNGNARSWRHLFFGIGCKSFWFHFHLPTNLDVKWQCQKLPSFVLWHWMPAILVPWPNDQRQRVSFLEVPRMNEDRTNEPASPTPKAYSVSLSVFKKTWLYHYTFVLIQTRLYHYFFKSRAMRLYKPLFGRSVGPSVRPSVTKLFQRLLKAFSYLWVVEKELCGVNSLFKCLFENKLFVSLSAWLFWKCGGTRLRSNDLVVLILWNSLLC